MVAGIELGSGSYISMVKGGYWWRSEHHRAWITNDFNAKSSGIVPSQPHISLHFLQQRVFAPNIPVTRVP
jgi:hypothetical protein